MRLAPILIIDEDSSERRTLMQALENSGFSVQGLQSGSQALSRIRSESFSLVITETRVQDLSDLDFIQAAAQSEAGPKVVVLTACSSVNGAVEAMQAGAADYLTKPFSFEHLEKTIKTILAHTDTRKVHTDKGRTSASKISAKQIVTQDAGFMRTLDLAKTIAPSMATVLIQGESGTGKELLAQFIHQHSTRPDEPYVAVNCAALPETLAESELFGHEKGAFTGAVSRKMGKFELAGEGTIVLDEIGEMPLPLQAKLLRVLQEREIDRVGGSATVPLRARVITISNVDLTAAVDEGKFREDLYYRINVVPLKVPALRERRGDIAMLAEYFLDKFSHLNRRSMFKTSEAALKILTHKPWKGNIRELENTIERAVLIGTGEELLEEYLMIENAGFSSDSTSPQRVAAGTTVRAMEKELIVSTLEEVEQNRTRAAEMLGISIRTLRNKLREYKRDSEQVASPLAS